MGGGKRGRHRHRIGRAEMARMPPISVSGNFECAASPWPGGAEKPAVQRNSAASAAAAQTARFAHGGGPRTGRYVNTRSSCCCGCFRRSDR